jgi:hypothetical protein
MVELSFLDLLLYAFADEKTLAEIEKSKEAKN